MKFIGGTWQDYRRPSIFRPKLLYLCREIGRNWKVGGYADKSTDNANYVSLPQHDIFANK